MPFFIHIGSGAAPSLLLDDYPAANAYSITRKLRTAYSGSAIRIRRSNDNAEQDIGFSGNSLDTAAITSFVGANSAYITTVYDQQGAKNLTQSTASAQPRIVNAGSLETENGQPIARSAAGYFFSHTLSTTSRWYNFFVGKCPSTATPCILGSVSSNDYYLLAENGGTSSIINNSLTVNSTRLDGASWTIPANRGLVYTALAAQFLLYSDVSFAFINPFGRVGYQNPTTAPMYHFQEMIFYSSDPSANQSAIESNINTHYGIF